MKTPGNTEEKQQKRNHSTEKKKSVSIYLLLGDFYGIESDA